MATIDKLTDIRDQTSALLAYANGITGAADTRLGDAVRTLGDGYGGGEDYLAQSLNNELTSYSSNSVTILPKDAFFQRTNLRELNLPNCTRINETALQGTGITVIDDSNFPALTYFGLRAFRASKLVRLSKPNTNMSIGGIAFEACTDLRIVDVLSFQTVEGNQNLLFHSSGITAFIIRRTDKVNPFPWSASFLNCPIGNKTGGYIYVPRILVDAYMADASWGQYPIRAIEDYPEITNY